MGSPGGRLSSAYETSRPCFVELLPADRTRWLPSTCVHGVVVTGMRVGATARHRLKAAAYAMPTTTRSETAARRLRFRRRAIGMCLRLSRQRWRLPGAPLSRRHFLASRKRPAPGAGVQRWRTAPATASPHDHPTQTGIKIMMPVSPLGLLLLLGLVESPEAAAEPCMLNDDETACIGDSNGCVWTQPTLGTPGTCDTETCKFTDELNCASDKSCEWESACPSKDGWKCVRMVAAGNLFKKAASNRKKILFIFVDSTVVDFESTGTALTTLNNQGVDDNDQAGYHKPCETYNTAFQCAVDRGCHWSSSDQDCLDS
eukprot:gene4789-7382_t